MKKTVLFRRKREGRTNYKKRLVLLKGRQSRLVVRQTNTQIIIQFVNYEPNGDKIITGLTSNSLRKMGWKNSCNSTPACYLAGLAAGKRALSKGVKDAILDTGLQSNVLGSRIYAAVKGVIDSGVNVPASEEAFPSPERLAGEHISSYRKTTGLKADIENFKKKILG